MKRITASIQALKDMAKEELWQFVTWVGAILHLNLFEPRLLTYPRVVIAKAEDQNGEAVLYVPLQVVLMWDSLAPKPGLSSREEALALKRISTLVDQVALAAGIREVYFFCADDRVADFVANREGRGDGYHEIQGVRVLKRVVPAR